MMEGARTAVPYTKASAKGPAEAGYSLRRQIYADDGVSGTIPLHERPEGRRLLEDAKGGKVSTVLVYPSAWHPRIRPPS